MRKTVSGILLSFILLCGQAHAQLIPFPEKITYQPGDIILLRSPNKTQRFLTGLATRGEITHAGLVILGKDGKTLELAEVLGNNDGISFKFNPGPKFGLITTPLLTVLEKERSEYNQEVFILPRKTPLPPEKSRALTAFVYSKEGKKYSSTGILGPLFLTPFKNRPIKAEGESYMCSAFVCAALVATDILPADFNPPAVAPFDFYDPSRFTRLIIVPARDAQGNIITEKQTNWFTGKTVERPIMVQATENAIKDGWRPAGPLLLPPAKITPTPDTFLNPEP
ncbi:MAG: hypothetical protein Q7R63_00255 [bacterium]|nr:hypothetical protein [bacterium]